MAEDLTYLPTVLTHINDKNGMELAPFSLSYFSVIEGEVVKASPGHYPLPFLISDNKKNCCKGIGGTLKIKTNLSGTFIRRCSGCILKCYLSAGR